MSMLMSPVSAPKYGSNALLPTRFVSLFLGRMAAAAHSQKYELTFGAPRETPGSVTFVFYRVFEACVLAKENPHVMRAYAMYFGCGMHLLHLFPAQAPAMLKLALTRRVVPAETSVVTRCRRSFVLL